VKQDTFCSYRRSDSRDPRGLFPSLFSPFRAFVFRSLHLLFNNPLSSPILFISTAHQTMSHVPKARLPFPRLFRDSVT